MTFLGVVECQKRRSYILFLRPSKQISNGQDGTFVISKLLEDVFKLMSLPATIRAKPNKTSSKQDSGRSLQSISGKPFEHVLTPSLWKRTVQVPDSDVKMTLPEYILAQNHVEVYCSSFNNLPELYRQLAVDTDSEIASPVVEYVVIDQKKFKGYACVELPFFGDPTSLRVLKFESNNGRTYKPNTMVVPLHNQHKGNGDVFYTLEGNVTNC